VGLILNTALTIITKSPISYKAFIDGDLSAVKWSCEKDCGSGTTNTGKEEPRIGKDDIPGVTWDSRVSTAGVNNCIMKAIQDLANKFSNSKITVTSLNDRSHSINSYHYQGKAGDLWTDNKKEWDSIEKYLNDQGFKAFCDIPDPNNPGKYKVVQCSSSQSTHIHFDMRNMPGKTCP
jgi:hypothetical protein